MREVSSEDCKRLQLNILINVAKFCDEHNIKYSLAYGTLIGAIRHKGFIPWDDDIDIIMMRNDYDRFVSLYHDSSFQLVDGNHHANHLHVRVADMSTLIVFQHSEIKRKFYNGGVWVDVFPIDNVPQSEKDYRSFMKQVRFLCHLQKCGELSFKTIWKGNLISRILRAFLYLIVKPLVRPIGVLSGKMMLKYNGNHSEKVANVSLWYLKYPSFNSSQMDETIDVEFEDHQFKAIKNYDEFLRGIYGDYMTPPPPEDRIPRHDYISYWR